MEQLLSGDLEIYIDVFNENHIDTKILSQLDDDVIKELIPSVGHRIKFKNRLSTWIADQELMVNSYFNSDNDKNCHQGPENENKPTEENNKTSNVTETFSTKRLENNYVRMHEENEDKQTEENNKTSNVTENNHESLDGRAVLKEGKNNGGLLKEQSRRKLSQIIILNVLEKDPSKQIKTDEFYKFAAEICEIFNKENALIYYSAYVSASSQQKKKNASGKLYETYISRRRILRARGDLPDTSRTSRQSYSTTSSSSCTLSPTHSNDNDVTVIEQLSWLRNNVDPWTKVEEYWTDTATARLRPILKGQGNITDYFKEFPSIKQPLGYTLLMKDFSYTYPDKENHFFCNIEQIQDNIIEYAKLKAKTTRDKYIKDTIEDYLSHADENVPETKTNAALLLLAYIINISPARKQRNKESWKPSRSEIRDGFITQAASSEEVGAILETRRMKFAKLGRTLQPLIIYVGQSVAAIESAYVVVNDVLYYFKKLVTAVDVAFKVFQATGACYPEEAADIWLVIQIGFYNIRTNFDRPTQAVNILLSDLGLSNN